MPRPKKTDDEKLLPLAFSVGKDDRAEIKAAAKRSGKKFSQWAREKLVEAAR